MRREYHAHRCRFVQMSQQFTHFDAATLLQAMALAHASHLEHDFSCTLVHCMANTGQVSREQVNRIDAGLLTNSQPFSRQMICRAYSQPEGSDQRLNDSVPRQASYSVCFVRARILLPPRRQLLPTNTAAVAEVCADSPPVRPATNALC